MNKPSINDDDSVPTQMLATGESTPSSQDRHSVAGEKDDSLPSPMGDESSQNNPPLIPQPMGDQFATIQLPSQFQAEQSTGSASTANVLESPTIVSDVSPDRQNTKQSDGDTNGTEMISHPSGSNHDDEWSAEKTQRYQDNGGAIDEQLNNGLPVFSGYDVLEVLGRGGMGIVYRAIQLSAKREVALKVVTGENNTALRNHQRFEVEAQAAARIEHPHVVTIYEVNTKSNPPYFSMQLVRGKSLLDLARQDSPDFKKMANFIAQASRGVQAAHELGILHRDLKPENILIDTKKQHAYVSDFGLAKPTDLDQSLTRAGEVFGTPAYMSPEQFRDAGTVDVRSDVYSLGAALYRVITGAPPFEAQSVIQLFDVIQSEPPKPPRTLVPRIPADLETICLKCLEKDPVDRYPSAAALARDLEAFIAGEPIAARPIGSIQRSIRWVRRHPYKIATIGSIAALLLLVLFLAPMVWKSVQESKRLAQLRRSVANLESRVEGISLEKLNDPLLLLEIEKIRQEDMDSYRRISSAYDKQQKQLLEQLLETPRLNLEDIEQLQKWIDAVRDPENAKQLSDRLEKRKANWNDVLVYASPFEKSIQWQAVKEGVVLGSIEASPEAMTLKVAPNVQGTSATVFLDVQSYPYEQLKVEFADNWKQSSRLGIALDGIMDSERRFDGWQLRLGIGRDKNNDKSTKPLENFEQAISENAPMVLELLRGNKVVSSNRIPSSVFGEGGLKLRLTRMRDAFSYQVNQSPETRFNEVFSFRAGEMGKPGIIWPPSVSVKSVSLQRWVAKMGAQPLDDADELYRLEKYDEATTAYRELISTNVSSQFRDECLYKLGCSLLRSGKRSDASSTWAELLNDSDSVWATRGSCELLRLLQELRKFEDTRGIVSQIIAKFPPEVVRSRVPVDLRNQIADLLWENYLKPSWVQRKGHNERIRMVIQAFDALDRPLEDKVLAQVGLYQGLMTEGEVREVLPSARGFMEQIIDNPEAGEFDIQTVVETVSQLSSYVQEYDGIEALYERAVNRIKTMKGGKPELLAFPRAQWEFARGNYEGSLAYCEAARSYRRGGQNSVHHDADLLLGWIYREMGQEEKAIETWRQSFESRTDESMGLLSVAILGSLAGAVPDDYGTELFDHVASQYPGQLAINYFLKEKPTELLNQGAQVMWQTAFGQQSARRLACAACSHRENLTIQLSVAEFYFFKRMTLDDPKQFDLREYPTDKGILAVCESLRRGFEEGRVTQADFLPIGIVYLGAGGLFGWNGIENNKNLTEEERSVLAYCLGCHFVNRKRFSEAKNALKKAMQSSDEAIRSEAKARLEKLTK